MPNGDLTAHEETEKAPDTAFPLSASQPTVEVPISSSGKRVYLPSDQNTALRQCEILSNVKQLKPVAAGPPISGSSQEPRQFHEVVHPYAVVLTQDCDLEQDFQARFHEGGSARLLIPNVLLCEVVTVVEMRTLVPRGSDIWRRICQNKDERYQYLQNITTAEDASGIGIPALGIDFKRYFTIPTEQLYQDVASGLTRRRARLRSPYIEHFSGRFAYFLSRIALPADHMLES